MIDSLLENIVMCVFLNSAVLYSQFNYTR